MLVNNTIPIDNREVETAVVNYKIINNKVVQNSALLESIERFLNLCLLTIW